MSRSQDTLQALDAATQAPARTGYGVGQSPYLTLAEGAIRYRFDATAPKAPVQAFREWLARNAVPVKRRGRTILIEMAVVDAMLGG